MINISLSVLKHSKSSMDSISKFDECDDCQRINNLEEDDLCSESKYGMDTCCIKYVCKDGCLWTCPLCLNLTKDIDNMFFVEIKQKELFDKYPDLSLIKDLEEIIISYLMISDKDNNNFTVALCNNCKDIEEATKIYPLKKWNGISEEEWRNRHD